MDKPPKNKGDQITVSNRCYFTKEEAIKTLKMRNILEEREENKEKIFLTEKFMDFLMAEIKTRLIVETPIKAGDNLEHVAISAMFNALNIMGVEHMDRGELIVLTTVLEEITNGFEATHDLEESDIDWHRQEVNTS